MRAQNSSGNKETGWITPAFAWVIVAMIGLAVSFVTIRSINSPTSAVAPTTADAVPLPAAPVTALSPTSAPPTPDAPAPTIPPTISPTPEPPQFFKGPFSYGTSAGGRPLHAYRLGTGPSVHAIIGAIHGGYEWSTAVLVSKTLEYLQDNPGLIPDTVTLYIIPCANPDGYVTGFGTLKGRMNGNGVDLNRNWDYQWQPTATHGTRPVDTGTGPFSEPETAALRDLILGQNVEAAIFYHNSLSRIFYGAEPHNSATYELALAVSEATGYPVAANIPGQITTGDAIDWMSAVKGLAGIEIELTTPDDIEWERNLRGLIAFLEWSPPSSPPSPPPPTVQTYSIGDSAK